MRIDHVHVEVADRDEAAQWFGTVLGLKPDVSLAQWAEESMGPLILATPDGVPVLALFARDCAVGTRDATIAFRVTGAEFLVFLNRLAEAGLMRIDGRPLTRADVVDHDLAWSLYFEDPWGNRFELTTYDHEAVKAAL